MGTLKKYVIVQVTGLNKVMLHTTCANVNTKNKLVTGPLSFLNKRLLFVSFVLFNVSTGVSAYIRHQE